MFRGIGILQRAILRHNQNNIDKMSKINHMSKINQMNMVTRPHNFMNTSLNKDVLKKTIFNNEKCLFWQSNGTMAT